MNRDILDRWTPENKNGKFPALTSLNTNPADYYLFSTRRDLYKSLDIWVKKLSYIRLQNIRLAYHFPSEWLHKLNIGGATVVWKHEISLFLVQLQKLHGSGVNDNLYSTPVPKSVTFNLSLNF